MQLSGDLSKVSLANLVQLVRNGELSGKIALLQGAKSATIFLKKGAVVHVETDSAVGREALMELFLWVTGSFSFLEEELGDLKYTLNPYAAEDSTERLLKDGLAYVEQKKYLDNLRLNASSVLKSTESVRDAKPETLTLIRPILDRIDGRRFLGEIIAQSGLSRRECVLIIWTLLTQGLATTADSSTQVDSEQLDLPPWVVARLQQDNGNISQAVIDMVIWVDRVKCWMYQVDADFSRVISQLVQQCDTDDSEDIWQEIQSEHSGLNGPLFGEAAVEPILTRVSSETANTNANSATNGSAASGSADASGDRKPAAPWLKSQTKDASQETASSSEPKRSVEF